MYVRSGDKNGDSLIDLIHRNQIVKFLFIVDLKQ